MLLIAGACTLAPACRPAAPPTPAPPPAPFPGLEPADRSFLVDPLTGYPFPVDAPRRLRLEEGFRALAAGDGAGARAAAAGLLSEEPGFHPARVLIAQADYYRRDLAAALEGVRPVAEAVPGYTAAELLRARAAEAAGEVVEAFEAYRAAAAASPPAAARAEEIAPRAVEVVFQRAEDAIARGRLADARAAVETLRAWTPEGEETLRAARLLAVAEDDPEAELAAVDALGRRFPDDRELTERRAELELSVGDPGRGLALLEDLAAAHPGDADLAARLDAAKFRWRFLQLPSRVSALGRAPELSRGGYAVLLYWLVPSVRYGRGSAPRIASDILDHPQREEIARVVNLGLMDVEPSVHRFAPERAVTRAGALEALLKLLGGGAGGDPLPCAAGIALEPRPSWESVCAAGAACGLIPSAGDCLPRAPLSGAEALELIRRGLVRLGS